MMTKNRFFSLNEARRFLALGLPVLVTQIAQMGMNFVDTAMTGQASTADMAAVAVSGSIWVPVSLLGMGCLLSLPAMMAHLVGGGEQQRTPHLLRQGLWLSSLLSLVLMGVFAFLSLHLELFGLDAELAPLAAGYLRAMLFGLPGMMLFVNVRGFLEGYARTRPAMLVGLLGLALNVPCNYVLIYGKLGLPQLGAVGCGVATALCYWFMGLTLALYARREARCRKLGPLFLPLLLPRTAGEGGEARRVDWPLVWRIFRIGLPGALAACFEASLFAVTALLLAPLGKVVVAGHQIAMNFSSIVYMLPLSLNITVAIRGGAEPGGRASGTGPPFGPHGPVPGAGPGPADHDEHPVPAAADRPDLQLGPRRAGAGRGPAGLRRRQPDPGIVADGEHRCAARLQRYPLHPGRLPVLLLDRGAGHGLDPGPDGLAGARHGRHRLLDRLRPGPVGELQPVPFAHGPLAPAGCGGRAPAHPPLSGSDGF